MNTTLPKDIKHPDPVSTKHLLSVEDYHKMGEANIFESGARVELIDGEIFER